MCHRLLLGKYVNIGPIFAAIQNIQKAGLVSSQPLALQVMLSMEVITVPTVANNIQHQYNIFLKNL
jgi:hypothetical protein